jgi:ATP-dependent exoDNAse (exonuclease V) beta subunit
VVLYTPLPFRSQTAMELSQSGADAEARVWYVGVTRAKERLDIVSSAEVGYEV